MIVFKKLLNDNNYKELIYFDETPVFKCPYSEVNDCCVYCTDYDDEDVNYNTCCYNRHDCKFKLEYVKTPKDLKALENLNTALKNTLPFGKMKGKSIQEVLESDPDYLCWLMSIELYDYVAMSIKTCSWIIVAQAHNKVASPIGSFGSPDENYGYGHWDDYPEYY